MEVRLAVQPVNGRLTDGDAAPHDEEDQKDESRRYERPALEGQGGKKPMLRGLGGHGELAKHARGHPLEGGSLEPCQQMAGPPLAAVERGGRAARPGNVERARRAMRRLVAAHAKLPLEKELGTVVARRVHLC